MKLKPKHFVYLINDVTSLILNKDSVSKLEDNARKLRVALIIISMLLLISVFINLYLIFK